MATSNDIQLLHRKIVDCEDLEWIVAGKPVVALFSSLGTTKYTDYDRGYLGRPLIDRDTPGCLRLWIGIDQKTNQFLVVLTQRIRMTTTNKYRLYFLCLPTESLNFDVSDPAIWRLSEGTVPLNMVTDATNTSSDDAQTARLLRISFSLGTDKSKVIMPDHPHASSISPMAMSLLRKLKTLAEASAFDLFTNHESWIQQALFKARDLSKRSGISCPKIEYSKFYPSGRAAVVNEWKNQGLHDSQDDTEVDSDDTTRKLLEREGYGMPPPVYEAPVAELPPPFDFAPPPVVAIEPHMKKDPVLLPANTTHTITSAEYLDTSTYDNLLLGHVMKSPSPEAHALSSAEAPLAPVPVSHLTHERALSKSCERQFARDRDHSIPPTEEAVASERSFPPLACGDLHSSTHCLDVCVQHTPEPERSVVSRCSTIESPVSCIPETPIALSCKLPPSTNNIRRIPAKHLPHIVSLQKTIPWLTELWKTWPFAHYTCIAHLLRIGTALNDLDADVYHVARARTLSTLLDVHASNSISPSPIHASKLAARRRFVEGGIYELISWLTILHPDADVEFCAQLRELAILREKVRVEVRGEAEGTERYFCLLGSFMRTKAQIVLGACARFGGTVVENDGFIVEKMVGEMVRIGF